MVWWSRVFKRRDVRVADLGPDVLCLCVADDASEAESTRDTWVGLTETERVAVEFAVAGLSNGQIADRRGTSPHTVANQLAAAYKKLRVAGRRELMKLHSSGRG